MRSGGGRGGGWRRSWESRRLCDGCAPVDPGDFDSQTNKEFLQFCVLESTFCAMPLSVVETPPPPEMYSQTSRGIALCPMQRTPVSQGQTKGVQEEDTEVNGILTKISYLTSHCVLSHTWGTRPLA